MRILLMLLMIFTISSCNMPETSKHEIINEYYDTYAMNYKFQAGKYYDYTISNTYYPDYGQYKENIKRDIKIRGLINEYESKNDFYLNFVTFDFNRYDSNSILTSNSTQYNYISDGICEYAKTIVKNKNTNDILFVDERITDHKLVLKNVLMSTPIPLPTRIGYYYYLNDNNMYNTKIAKKDNKITISGYLSEKNNNISGIKNFFPYHSILSNKSNSYINYKLDIELVDNYIVNVNSTALFTYSDGAVFGETNVIINQINDTNIILDKPNVPINDNISKVPIEYINLYV